MPPKAGQSNKDSVEALLSDLDNLGTAEASPRPSTSSAKPATPSATGRPSASDDAQSLLNDLDNLVQRRAPTPRKQPQQQANNTEKQSSAAADAAPPSSSSVGAVEPSPASVAAGALEAAPAPEQSRLQDPQTPPVAPPSSSAATTAASSTGGWGSVWSSAAKLADQARAEIEKRAQSEQAREISQRGWGLTQGVRDFVKEAGLEKLGEDLTKVGKRGWTEVINAVAPPISAHEVIQVTLSHDMVGFDGVPDVTFKILARVMESQQVGRGTDQQLIVNQAPESTRPSTSSQAETQPPMTVDQGASTDDTRDMKAVEGYEEGWKLAESSLSRLIANHEPEAPKASSVSVPVTHCPVFLRIQPIVAPLPGAAHTTSASIKTDADSATAHKNVSFLLLLQDPSNGLSHKTCSQTFPHAWMSESFEDNPWIEQALVDVLEGALSVIGQDYINGRQTGKSRSIQSEANPAN